MKLIDKSAERALEKYPKKIEWVGNQWDGAPFDVNSESRVAYKQGYEQAQKDLQLTWEDISDIIEIHEDVLEMESCENVYMEVLKRFKAMKEK